MKPSAFHGLSNDFISVSRCSTPTKQSAFHGSSRVRLYMYSHARIVSTSRTCVLIFLRACLRSCVPTQAIYYSFACAGVCVSIHAHSILRSCCRRCQRLRMAQPCGLSVVPLRVVLPSVNACFIVLASPILPTFHGCRNGFMHVSRFVSRLQIPCFTSLSCPHSHVVTNALVKACICPYAVPFAYVGRNYLIARVRGCMRRIRTHQRYYYAYPCTPKDLSHALSRPKELSRT